MKLPNSLNNRADIIAYNIVDTHMKRTYNVPLSDMVISKARGYWNHKDGRIGAYYFADYGLRSSLGTFISPFWAWKELGNINEQ